MNKERVLQLVDWVEQGRIVEAMQEFYAENVEMQDNTNPPTIGLAANIEREQAFVEQVADLHESKALGVVVEGDTAVVHWILDFTNRGGQRLRLDQLALQTWKDGKIVSERFVYDSAAVVQEKSA